MNKSEVVKRVMDAYHHSAVEGVMPCDQFFIRFSVLYGKYWVDLSDEEKDHAKTGNFQGCYSLTASWDDIYVGHDFEFTAYACGFMLGVVESIEVYSHERNWESQW
jgi:hypothetical protein